MNTDVLIIGSGIAGMSLAIKTSKFANVVLCTKKKIISGATPWAQGGVAGVRKLITKNQLPIFNTGEKRTEFEKIDSDSHKQHIEDTFRVGSCYGNKEAIKILIENAEKELQFLEECGVHFDKSLHREAGHSAKRIYHVADHTGMNISKALVKKIRETENITVLENTFAIDVIKDESQIIGATFFSQEKEFSLFSKKTILATGGGGQVYEKTTTPKDTTGDGIAMAVRAGVKISDMEFIQFHPTALDYGDSPYFLLTEALRGAGAKVVNKHHHQVCDPLLPRDKLSQNIFLAQKKSQIFLSLTHQKNKYWKKNFPTIFQKLQEIGISPESDLIPITPVTHFFCGGIQTDTWGKTNLKNLYAVGEVACTGVHGANRLASNSLLEGVVFAGRIGEKIQNLKNEEQPSKFFQKQSGKNKKHKKREPIQFEKETKKDEFLRKKIQKICFQKLGIVRLENEIQEAIAELEQIKPKGTETENMRLTALEIAKAAFSRKKSLGAHYLIKE